MFATLFTFIYHYVCLCLAESLGTLMKVLYCTGVINVSLNRSIKEERGQKQSERGDTGQVKCAEEIIETDLGQRC